MRRALICALFVGLATLAGCGPTVSQNDLGTIVYEVPTVPGAEEPYRLPDLPPLPRGTSPRSRMPPVPPPTTDQASPASQQGKAAPQQGK